MEAGKACEEGRTPSLEVEYRLLHKDIGYRWVLTRGACLRDSQGRVYRMAGSLPISLNAKSLNTTCMPEDGINRNTRRGCGSRVQQPAYGNFRLRAITQEIIPTADESLQESIASVMKPVIAADLTRGPRLQQEAADQP
jgi:hypothetical protein